ncbi:MAG: succinate dehydrogenase cytochrome b subunit [Lentimicrobiaceae bacterium]|jgi:succinate dehydrogenase / fumarate reductase cytochrome b subunit|nr:succinate dehydrogenase cytochrome b subunit [Lentimicrobiaceae bacterium]
MIRYSSITQKIIIALAGFFLITFLVVHLSINLLLLRNDDGEWFTAAAHFMSTNYVLKVFEVILFGGFALHILLAILVQIQNWWARPQHYKIGGFSHTSFFSKYMIHTGVIIILFLVIHFSNFYFVKAGWVAPPTGVDRHDFYTMAQLLFSDFRYSLLYIVFMLFLGFHLNHAFQAAFQTLGLNHSKYNTAIKLAGILYSIIIPLGFAIIPMYYLWWK